MREGKVRHHLLRQQSQAHGFHALANRVTLVPKVHQQPFAGLQIIIRRIETTALSKHIAMRSHRPSEKPPVGRKYLKNRAVSALLIRA